MSRAMELLQQQKEQLQQELSQIEQKIYDMEREYFSAEYCNAGTVLKGFEGFLSSKETKGKRSRMYKLDEMLFSLSSSTSPATADLQQQQSMFGMDLDASDAILNPGFAKKGYATKSYSQKQYSATKGRRE